MIGSGAARPGGPLRWVLSWWRSETLKQQRLEHPFYCSSASGCPAEVRPGRRSGRPTRFSPCPGCLNDVRVKEGTFERRCRGCPPGGADANTGRYRRLVRPVLAQQLLRCLVLLGALLAPLAPSLLFPLTLLPLVGFSRGSSGLWDPTGPGPPCPSASCYWCRVNAASSAPVGFD